MIEGKGGGQKASCRASLVATAAAALVLLALMVVARNRPSRQQLRLGSSALNPSPTLADTSGRHSHQLRSRLQR